MRKALVALLFAIFGVGAALLLSSTAAGASTGNSDGSRQSQSATNTNRTGQQSQASASTEQLNLNTPVSVLSPGSNSGDVDQSNKADTTVGSANYNSSDQSVDQAQRGSVEQSGKESEKDPKGNKESGKDSKDPKESDKDPKDSDKGRPEPKKDGHGEGSSLNQAQAAANSNETTQDSSATANTYQANIYIPIAILSPGANSGNVYQSNEADTTVFSGNYNDSYQTIDQSQWDWLESFVNGWSSLSQGQGAANSNETSQGSSATANTYQANVYIPISILSPGANSGDVYQSNEADTVVFSGNYNDSYQSVDQSQRGSVESGHGWKSLNQSQRGANSNETTQDSSAEATTKQANVNTPISILDFGSRDKGKDDHGKDKGNDPKPNHDRRGDAGDVDQSNKADTVVFSGNYNDSAQSVGQSQWGSVKSDHGKDDCRCKGHDSKPRHDKPRHDDYGKGTHDDHGKGHGKDNCRCQHRPANVLNQNQEAANSNETTQDSSASATTKQANVNTPISILDFGSHDKGNDDHGKDKGHGKGNCGCQNPDPKPNHGRHGDHGDVDQSNKADTLVFSGNWNDSDQSIDQTQWGWIAA